MRVRAIMIGAALALAAIGSAAAQFPAPRGTAPPPPAEAASNQEAPPQGAGPGGIDFGQWRGGEPTAYGRQLQTQLRARYAGQAPAQIKADLEANGFACADQANGLLQCRIEIMDGPCALDWYAVVERPRAEPIVGFDRMCLGAR